MVIRRSRGCGGGGEDESDIMGVSALEGIGIIRVSMMRIVRVISGCGSGGEIEKGFARAGRGGGGQKEDEEEEEEWESRGRHFHDFLRERDGWKNKKVRMAEETGQSGKQTPP